MEPSCHRGTSPSPHLAPGARHLPCSWVLSTSPSPGPGVPSSPAARAGLSCNLPPTPLGKAGATLPTPHKIPQPRLPARPLTEATQLTVTDPGLWDPTPTLIPPQQRKKAPDEPSAAVGLPGRSGTFEALGHLEVLSPEFGLHTKSPCLSQGR